jgi:hypothetical protein
LLFGPDERAMRPGRRSPLLPRRAYRRYRENLVAALAICMQNAQIIPTTLMMEINLAFRRVVSKKIPTEEPMNIRRDTSNMSAHIVYTSLHMNIF